MWAQVVAAAKGVVKSIAYSDEIGTTVTMDLGDGYELIYGQLQYGSVGRRSSRAGAADRVCQRSDKIFYSVEGSNIFLR